MENTKTKPKSIETICVYRMSITPDLTTQKGFVFAEWVARAQKEAAVAMAKNIMEFRSRAWVFKRCVETPSFFRCIFSRDPERGGRFDIGDEWLYPDEKIYTPAGRPFDSIDELERASFGRTDKWMSAEEKMGWLRKELVGHGSYDVDDIKRKYNLSYIATDDECVADTEDGLLFARAFQFTEDGDTYQIYWQVDRASADAGAFDNGHVSKID